MLSVEIKDKLKYTMAKLTIYMIVDKCEIASNSGRVLGGTVFSFNY